METRRLLDVDIHPNVRALMGAQGFHGYMV